MSKNILTYFILFEYNFKNMLNYSIITWVVSSLTHNKFHEFIRFVVTNTLLYNKITS